MGIELTTCLSSMNRKKPQEILGAFLIQSIQKTRAWSDGAGHWVSKFALS